MTGAVDLHASQQGERGDPPMVIVHGLLGSSSNWGGIAREMTRGDDPFAVWAVDMRNHGRSGHVDDMSYPAMAADLAAWITAEALGPVTLVGHSMGGKVAMRLALEHPDLVARLVVADIAPRLSPGDHRHIIAAMQALDFSALKSRRDADAQLGNAIPEAPLRAWLLQNLVLASADGSRPAHWRINIDAIAAAHDTLIDWPDTTGLAPFTGACRFIGGANSTYLGPEPDTAITALFPTADVVLIPNAGHWLHAEQPRAFVSALRDFLR